MIHPGETLRREDELVWGSDNREVSEGPGGSGVVGLAELENIFRRRSRRVRSGGMSSTCFGD